MATNQYFKNFNSFPQQELLNNLTKEVIQMSGINMLYLLKKTTGFQDTILNEDPLVKYDSAFEVEMFINLPEGFEGTGDTISKFGLDIQDELILTVHKERFFDEVGLKSPREGDLVYLPLGKGLFTITFVEHENPFYTLGKNTVFEITCESFKYSNEHFNIVGIESGAVFDQIERENAISKEFTLTPDANSVFFLSETIFQGPDLENATATAKIADQIGNKIHIYRQEGEFVNGTITGDIAGKTGILESIDDQMMISSEFSDNKEFEIEGDNILDFSEIDPWSEGDL